MVSQCTLNSTSGDPSVTTIGPPPTPAGLIVPDICIIRFGWVGPMTAQW
jgi:hypothetical protein